ncbi:MAG: hypothetical protein HY288_18210 [Planctomycetia bacterium]|nr:hypothetical protein [Planctomycetia bacterium]
MPTSWMRDVVHPSINYDRIALADEDNARGAWLHGCGLVCGREEPDSLTSVGDGCDCGSENRISRHPPAPEEYRARVNQLLAQNSRALSEFEAGLALGSLKVAIVVPDFEGGIPLTELRGLARLVRLCGTQSADDGDLEYAARHFAGIARAGRMIASCDGTLVLFLVGFAFEGVGLQGLAELTERNGVPRGARQSINAAISEAIDAAVVVRALQSEFCNYSWPVVERVNEIFSAQGLDGMLNWFLPEADPNPDSPVDFNPWIRPRHEFTKSVLEAHASLWTDLVV